jgi:hypothetical protein
MMMMVMSINYSTTTFGSTPQHASPPWSYSELGFVPTDSSLHCADSLPPFPQAVPRIEYEIFLKKINFRVRGTNFP